MTENTHPMADAVTRLAESLAASLGLTLWGVEVLPGGRSVVRVYVESAEAGQGVDIEQCAELSRLLGLSLDVEDCIPGAYVLEVSSPGLERRFFTAGQLSCAVGKQVEISLYVPLPDFPLRRKFQGELRAAPEDGQGLFSLAASDILPQNEEPPLVAFSFDQLRKVKQIHFVPEKALPGKGKKAVTEKKPAAGKKAEKGAAGGTVKIQAGQALPLSDAAAHED